MKKALLTTTALVAFAGAAAAEVSLSGSAEIGIKGGSGMETQFHDDIDVSFTLSGETDNGLTFGAKIDLDEADVGRFTGGTSQLNSVFVSGGFGTVTLGDTDGAFDWAMQDIGIGSSLTDDHTTHAGYNGNSGLDGLYDSQVLRYDNTFGDFGVALSAQMDDNGVGGTSWGLGVKYNAALGGVDLGLGLGYQTGDVVAKTITTPAGAGPDGLDGTADDVAEVSTSAVTGDTDVWGISVDAKFGGGFRAILNYSDMDAAGVSTTYTGLGLGYTMDALTVSANYGEYDTAGVSTDGYGIAVNYDLGGGATVMAGYGSGSVAGAPSVDTWSLGLGLSF